MGGVRKTPRERFVTVAARRTETILRTLRLLGNCANTAGYEYRPDEVERMFVAIERELQVARAKFEQKQKRKIEFSFET